MDSKDKFNDFVGNELIDSWSSDVEDNFYFDATNIIAQKSLNEPLHQGSIIGHALWIEKDICGTTLSKLFPR
jgi:hypothetical protein